MSNNNAKIDYKKFFEKTVILKLIVRSIILNNLHIKNDHKKFSEYPTSRQFEIGGKFVRQTKSILSSA